MVYINYRINNEVETIDEFTDRKEARKMLQEYNLAYGKSCYISSRCTNDWRKR